MSGKPRQSSTIRLGFRLLWLMPMLLLVGCAAYQVGNGTLYRPDIQSIHVPIFESKSFRRGLGERLTEAVIKEIELKTPYKVECAADADSMLSGQIVSETKSVQSEDVNDNPRNIGINLVVQVRWETRQGDLLRQSVALPLPPTLQIAQAGSLIPEGGASIATAHDQAIRQLAEQIVSQLEYAW